MSKNRRDTHGVLIRETSTMDNFDKQINPKWKPEKLVIKKLIEENTFTNYWKIIIIYNMIMSLGTWIFFYFLLLGFGFI